jgi:hypothetical protein
LDAWGNTTVCTTTTVPLLDRLRELRPVPTTSWVALGVSGVVPVPVAVG